MLLEELRETIREIRLINASDLEKNLFKLRELIYIEEYTNFKDFIDQNNGMQNNGLSEKNRQIAREWNCFTEKEHHEFIKNFFFYSYSDTYVTSEFELKDYDKPFVILTSKDADEPTSFVLSLTNLTREILEFNLVNAVCEGEDDYYIVKEEILNGKRS